MSERFRLVVIGMIMGVAEIIPGVSGGTIAFITGIYPRLIDAVKQCNPAILRVLKNDGCSSAWRRIDGYFLLSLVSGMGIAIILFASALTYLLDNQSIFIWSFFFSLVLCSVLLVVKQMDALNWQTGLWLGAGIALGMVLINFIPMHLEPTLPTIFIGGAIAICAFLLPGLSGSFVLLILGLYQCVLEAIKHLDMVFIFTFAGGCALGLMTFSHILSRLMASYRQETLALLAGFILGSVLKLWPWQYSASYILAADGSAVSIVQKPVLPYTYQGLTGMDANLLLAAVGFCLGAIAVLGLHRLSRVDSG